MDTLTFTGDVMLGRAVNRYLNTLKDPRIIWGDTLDDLRKSDLVFVNLECALTKATKRGRKDSPVFFFRSDPSNVQALVAANVSFCCLANNHVLDFAENGLIETLEILDSVGIKHAGGGKNLTEARKPADLQTKELKIKVFAFSDNEQGWEASDTKPGINYIPIDTKDKRFIDLLSDIQRAKEMGFFIIVSAHWGPNMVRLPSTLHTDFAHRLAEGGVDIFHGHSSHVFQPIEVYKDKIIFYDCGEFLDDYAVDPLLRNDESFLFQVVLEEGKIQKIILKPIKIETTFTENNLLKIFVKRAKGEEASLIIAKMIGLSEKLLPRIESKDDKLEVGIEM